MNRTVQSRHLSRTGDTTRLDLLAVRKPGSARQSKLPGLALVAVGAVLLFVLPAALILYQFVTVPDHNGPAAQKEGPKAPEIGQNAPEPGREWRDLLAAELPLDQPAPLEDPQPGRNGVPFRQEAEDAPAGGPPPAGNPPEPHAEHAPRPPIGPNPPEPGRPGRPHAEEPPPPWKIELRKQMEKRISFDFVDTPLPDVVAFLSNLAGATIILDPGTVKDDPPTITLKVADMRLGAALDWILRLAGLEYALQDEAIFITTKERLQAMTPVRVYDCRQYLDPRAQEELLHLIVQVTADEWRPPQAIIRFVDGRLVLRNRKAVMNKAETFLDEFIRASEKTAAKAKKGKEPALPEQDKVAEELRAEERRAAEEHRAKEKMLAVREQEEIAVEAPKDFGQFWHGYLRFMKDRAFARAVQICALAARAKALMTPEGEQVITEDQLDILAYDARQVQNLYERARERLAELQGQEVVLADGGEMRVLGVDDGRLIGMHDGAKVAVGLDKLRPDQVLKIGLGAEEDPKVRAYQEALFAFHYYPPEKAKAFLEEAVEHGLDMSFYQKRLAKRLEEAPKKPELEEKAEKKEF